MPVGAEAGAREPRPSWRLAVVGFVAAISALLTVTCAFELGPVVSTTGGGGSTASGGSSAGGSSAGGSAGAGCGGAKELCDAGCTDTTSDPSHCGECGHGCPPLNAQVGGCVAGQCWMPSSCQEILDAFGAESPPSGVYRLASTALPAGYDDYCDLDLTHDGGGWTLVMKLDGDSAKFTFNGTDSASAPIWLSDETVSPDQPDIDDPGLGAAFHEAKLQSFSEVGFDALRLVIRDPREGYLTARAMSPPLTVAAHQLSLRAAMASPPQLTVPSTPLAAWTAIFAPDVPYDPLQSHCLVQGIAVPAPADQTCCPAGNVDCAQPCGCAAYPPSARIGFVTNDQDDCCTPDSRIGFGLVSLSCGVFGGIDQDIHAHGYIFVR